MKSSGLLQTQSSPILLEATVYTRPDSPTPWARPDAHRVLLDRDPRKALASLVGVLAGGPAVVGIKYDADRGAYLLGNGVPTRQIHDTFAGDPDVRLDAFVAMGLAPDAIGVVHGPRGYFQPWGQNDQVLSDVI